MEKLILPVYEMKTLAEAINAVDLPMWKKWLLKKLIPQEFHQYAPQTFVDALPKGVRIASMHVTYDSVLDTDCFPNGSLAVGGDDAFNQFRPE